jgi:hypothetical protein
MPQSMTWIALAAFLIGAFVRAIKSDGAKILLANLGLPPIPTRALPFVALGAGAIAGMLDAYLGGAAWTDAVYAGITAAASAVFGHELLSGIPGAKKLVGIALVVGFASTTTACTPGARTALAEAAFDLATCALTSLDLPDEQILKKCGANTLADRERLLRIVGTARQEQAVAAALAADRAKEDAMRAALAGKIGACSQR